MAHQSAPDPDDDLAELGRNLLRQGKWGDAEATLRAGLAAREKSQPAAWSTHGLRSLLGGALLGRKRYADAEPLLLSGYRGMAAAAGTIPDAGRVRLNEAAGRLVDLYSATGDAAQAAKWRAERATIREVLPRPRELQ